MKRPAPDRPIGVGVLAICAASGALILREMHVITWPWRWVGYGAAALIVVVFGLLLLGSFGLEKVGAHRHRASQER